MKQANTVKSHKEFDAIIRLGAKIKSPHFSLHYVKEETPQTRIGLAVGKRNGGAVTRVRIKRQVRAMIADYGDYSLPVDVILVIRPSFSEGDFHALEAELHASFDRLKEQLH